jgi:hypothetical protein
LKPGTSPAEILAVTTDIPPGTEEGDLFSDLLSRQSQKGKKNLNPAAEQRSSPQGCTVRPETSAGQSSLGGFSASPVAELLEMLVL